MKCPDCDGYSGHWTGVLTFGTGVWHECPYCDKGGNILSLNDLWKACCLKRDYNQCQRCYAKATVVHHIIHKTGGRYLRFLIDNGVSLCHHCHSLDDKGELRPWCEDHFGEDKLDEMKLAGNQSVASKSFDEDIVRKELKDYLAISVSEPGLSI